MMECDVKLSADGVPFLLHDDTLDRTTNGQGKADEWAWSDLIKLDAGRWHSEWFRNTRLAQLADIAGLLRRTQASINLEIKPLPGHAAKTGEEVATHAARLWLNAEKRFLPLLSSFDLEALSAAAKAAPHLPRALLIGDATSTALDAARRLGCIALIYKHNLIEASQVQTAHEVGLHVLAYTVNDIKEAQRLHSLGVAGLMTDAIDHFNPRIDNAVQLR
jgi:glycerophosphoryl diester phosphodiesterase